jgi:hypothetical protein
MVKQSFPWNSPETWQRDYVKIFEEVKDELQEATSIFLPNYDLTWILRTDASSLGVSVVLLQIYKETPASTPCLQPIDFASQKSSIQAKKWSAFELEAYGIYFGVKHFSYYLRCKPFIIETDHNSCIWMVLSAVSKLIRWRIYLQSFITYLRHIPGRNKLAADWLSRCFHTDDEAMRDMQLTMIPHMQWSNMEEVDISRQEEDHTMSIVTPAPTYKHPDELIRQYHGGRVGHFGARFT